MTVLYVSLPVIAVIFLTIMSSMKQVPPGAVFIVERMGSFYTVYTEGVHFKTPFLDRIVAKVNVTEQCLPLESVTAVASDGTPIVFTAGIHFRIVDAAAFFYSTENSVSSLGRLTLTALRDIISSTDGETVLGSKAETENKVTRAIAPATEKWGLLVSEIKLTELSSNQ